MNQRTSVSRRPSGTDGSDYSYRMVVDSRYQKVAKGKSRLHALILTQVFIQLAGALYSFASTSKKDALDSLAISSAALGFISPLIGELGWRRSRVNFLKVYLVGSSVALLLLLSTRSTFLLEIVQDPSNWEKQKVELLEMARVLIGFLFHIFSIRTVVSLINNMSPPKRAS